jgi:uncharacterized membrane-anchored protein
MIDLLKRPAALFAMAALLLTGILTSIVAARVAHLKNGREIVLNIRPVDPRDLFKGDYVRLGFDISQATREQMKDLFAASHTPVYVLLDEAGTEGAWRIASVATIEPKASTSQIVLRAVASGSGWLRYGIERYYVPEGTGPKLEDKARTNKLSAIVAVNARGEAAIKGLKLDGKPIHVEPLL